MIRPAPDSRPSELMGELVETILMIDRPDDERKRMAVELAKSLYRALIQREQAAAIYQGLLESHTAQMTRPDAGLTTLSFDDAVRKVVSDSATTSEAIGRFLWLFRKAIGETSSLTEIGKLAMMARLVESFRALDELPRE